MFSRSIKKNKKLEIMRIVRIHEGKVALVFKNGNYNRVITQGKHWIKFNETLVDYDLTIAFHAPKPLEIWAVSSSCC